MKKLLFTSFLLLSLILVGCSNNPTVRESELSEKEALEIVFNALDLTEDQLTVYKIQKDYEHQDFKYEIDLYDDDFEYDYEVDSSGKIIKAEKEALRKTKDNEFAKDGINEQEALEIALSDANLKESDVHILKIEKDYDYATYEYEIEFIAVKQEYDYEISASGEILKKEVEKRK